MSSRRTQGAPKSPGHTQISGKVDMYESSPQVLIARGDISPYDKRMLTMLLGRLGLTTEYVDPSFEQESSLKIEELKAEIVRLKTLLSGETPSYQYKFAEITTPEQYLVREHLEDIRSRVSIGGFVGRTFNYLVDAYGSHQTYRWETNDELSMKKNRIIHERVFRDPVPLDKIIVVKREEIGLPPYEGSLDHYSKNSLGGLYAIQAGSVVEAAHFMQEHTPQGNLAAAQRGILIVSAMLERQFE